MELFLLMRSVVAGAVLERSLELAGEPWHLVRLPMLKDGSGLPDFVCVSYAWGVGRLPHVFDADRGMSDQTLPSLQAALRNSAAAAFWTDALCVPFDQPARRQTLASMGYIYFLAKAVIVSLPHESSRALEESSRHGQISETSLLSLEKDGWIRSVWTYQEVMNCESVIFVSGSSATQAKVEEEHLFNHLGMALSVYKKKYKLDSLAIREQLPGLDAFEDICGDWMLRRVYEDDRSALQVISDLDRRQSLSPANTLCAMLGSVAPTIYAADPGASLAELALTVIDACQRKGDFSYLFTSNTRDADSTSPWRPRPELLHSILPWHSWGPRQGGKITSDGLRLSYMMELKRAEAIGKRGRQRVKQWLHDSDRSYENIPGMSDHQLADTTLACLRSMGYTGSPKPHFTTHGIVFSQNNLNDDTKHSFFVSTQVRWVCGAPVIMELTQDPISYDTGVFVGEVDKADAADVVFPRRTT